MQILQESANNPVWDNEKSVTIYNSPIFSEFNVEIENSPESHIGPFKNALDFMVPDGTLVLTAADGIIFELEDESSSWGNGPEFRDYLNYLTLAHKNGEYSQYCHLALNSVSKLGLKVGSRVKRGEIIGVVGKTGWTDSDHLHFVVYKVDEKSLFGFKSVVPKFADH